MARSFLLPLLVLLLASCATLPPRQQGALQQKLPVAVDGPLADFSIAFFAEKEESLSGFHLLAASKEALEARLALIDSARHSIDLQYFIWKNDAVGTLLFDRLLQAADRGVRVRLIIDDFFLVSSTRDLTALNLHPNLEIRIFNPNPSRDSPIVNALHYLATFQALNRRMHNKLLIADGRMAIAGGRNIANEYFGLGKKFNFVDLDVLTAGAVVQEAAMAFDQYWNTDAVYPVSSWELGYGELTPEDLRKAVAVSLKENAEILSSYPLSSLTWDDWLAKLDTALIKGEAHFLQDDPVEIDEKQYRLIDMIGYLARPTKEEFILSTPYLIPVGETIANLQELADRGVAVTLLTNSLASTNHTLVNSHYRKYRRPLLATGLNLHEFRHQPSEELRAIVDVPPQRAPFISLHAKVMVADRHTCFIGSLNFDPRALVINTENGLLIESPELAAELTHRLKGLLSPENSWQVLQSKGNQLIWRAGTRVLDGQPARSFWQAIADTFGFFLPIEGQL